MKIIKSIKINGKEVKVNETVANTKFAYEWCHKIYICETPEEEKRMAELGYELIPLSEIEKVYSGSCDLKFISNSDLTTDYAEQCKEAIFVFGYDYVDDVATQEVHRAEKLYDLSAVHSHEGPLLIKTKQTLFQALYLAFSQVAEYDKGAFSVFYQDCAEVYEIDPSNEEQLRELGLMIDYDESHEFSLWETVHSEYLSANQDAYLFARVFEHLAWEYKAIHTVDDRASIKMYGAAPGEFELLIEAKSEEGSLCIYAKESDDYIVAGGNW